MRRNDLERKLSYIESLFIEIECNVNNNHNNNSSKILIGSLYRRPSSNINDFLSELENIFNLIANENKKIYLLGDFNINLFNFDNDLHVRRFVNLMHSNNMFNVINKSTRVTNTLATLIDHVWTNNFSNLYNNGILFEKNNRSLSCIFIFQK